MSTDEATRTDLDAEAWYDALCDFDDDCDEPDDFSETCLWCDGRGYFDGSNLPDGRCHWCDGTGEH